MTALVCLKRSFSCFEDEVETYCHHPFKKPRYSSYSPLTSKQTLIEKLSQTFPLMDTQILDETLEDCDFDIDLAINKLRELCLASSVANLVQEQKPGVQVNDNVISEEDIKWVELFVREMSSAISVDDAKARAVRALAARDQEKGESTNQLKEHNVILSQENCVLKKAFRVQHDRLKGLEESTKEIEKLSGMLCQCKEELRRSEMSNYALRVQLSQAQISGSSMINFNNFPPDVY